MQPDPNFKPVQSTADTVWSTATAAEEELETTVRAIVWKSGGSFGSPGVENSSTVYSTDRRVFNRCNVFRGFHKNLVTMVRSGVLPLEL